MITSLLMNMTKVLHAERALDKRFPASLTKMLTAYLTFEGLREKRLTLDTLCPISLNASKKEGSTLQLHAGRMISVKDALSCMLVKSANDAATVLGETLEGSERAAVSRMNEKAKILHMHHSHFTNLSGLHHEEHVSTAFDMALLAKALIVEFPEYYPFFGMKPYRYQNQVYENFNTLLGYNGVDGMKTGNTDAAGFNLVVSALQNNKRIIAVVMKANNIRQRDDTLKALILRGNETLNPFKAIYHILDCSCKACVQRVESLQ